MPGYLKTPDGWLPVRAGALDLDDAAAMTYVTTLGGQRLATSRGRVGRRWAIGASAQAADAMWLWEALAAGVYGIGPFDFIDPWAAGTNIMPPSRAAFHGTIPQVATVVNAPLRLPDGTVVPRYVVPTSSGTFGATTSWINGSPATPTIANVPVTVSGWLRATGAVALLFQRASTSTGRVQATFGSTGTAWRPFSLTAPTGFPADSGDTLLTLGPPVTGFAALQVTYTTGRPKRWGPGYRPAKVVLDRRRLSPDSTHFGRLSSTMTLEEVGAV